MVFLGVDPGSSLTGFGVVSLQHGSLRHVGHGVIRAGTAGPFPHRLQRIYAGMMEVMERYRPDGAAVEAVFHAKNARSSLIMGHARGVILLAAVQWGVEIDEYSPLQVKLAVTGYGHAHKEQIRTMVKGLLGIREVSSLDASDALAVAICHAHSQQMKGHMRMKP
jgi:crossover junction endodeoxyribonuclease RuvC